MSKKEDFKIILLSSLGGMLEFYDFIIFSLFSITLGATFFPTDNMFTQALLAFSVFAVGYLARPIGGIIFGHLGDKYGRKKSFIISIFFMGLSTMLLAILPSYAAIGILAPLLFVCLRILQGLSVGGEIPNSVIYVKESIIKHPGLACGFIFCFINLGVFLAQTIKSVTTSYMSIDIAWRVSFLIGGAIAFASYFLRKKLHESQAYKNSHINATKIPLLELLTKHKIPFLRSFLIISIMATATGYFSLYLPTYFTFNKINNSGFYLLTNLLTFSILCIFFGFLADKFRASRILTIGTIGILISGSFLYYQITNHQISIYLLILNASFLSMIISSSANYATDLLNISIRSTGLALSYNLAFTIFNGLLFSVTTMFIDIGYILAPLYLNLFIIISISTLVLLINRITLKKT